jgi:hypothetical protein
VAWVASELRAIVEPLIPKVSGATGFRGGSGSMTARC